MNIILTISSTKFSLNGIQYFKNYISSVAGNQITIFNCYEREDIRLDWTDFGNVSVNGVVYGNVADLQIALLPIIYTRASLGGGGTFDLSVNEIGVAPISSVNQIEFDGATVSDETGGKVKVTIAGGGLPQDLQSVLDVGNEWSSENINITSGYTDTSIVKEHIDEDWIGRITFSDTFIQIQSDSISDSFSSSINIDNNTIQIVSSSSVGESRINVTDSHIELTSRPDTLNYSVRITTDLLTNNTAVQFPNKSGTVAFLDDIPPAITIDATPTDGSSNAVSSNGVFDALALKTLPLVSDGSVVAITGVNVPTIMYSVEIPANLLNDYNRLMAQIQVTKSSGVGTSSLTFNVNSINSLVGAVQIGFSSFVSTIQFASLERKFKIDGITLSGYPFAANAATDSQNSSALRGSTSYDTTTAIWFIVAVNPASVAESHLLESIEINARRRKTTI